MTLWARPGRFGGALTPPRVPDAPDARSCGRLGQRRRALFRTEGRRAADAGAEREARRGFSGPFLFPGARELFQRLGNCAFSVHSRRKRGEGRVNRGNVKAYGQLDAAF